MNAYPHDRRRGRAQFPNPGGAAAFSWTAITLAGCVGVGFATASALEPASKTPSVSAPAPSPYLMSVANPTGHTVRGEDRYGAGFFGASRGGGVRSHRGADYVSEPGEPVFAPIGGEVSRIGYAYRGDQRYRFVELINPADNRTVRVLYVGPSVIVGDILRAGDPIGTAQDLSARYPRGITNHVHVELQQSGALADPTTLLPLGEGRHETIALWPA